MNADHDKLKKLFEGYVNVRKPANRDRCPSPFEIVESFEPTTRARRKKRIIDHISVCPCCREEFLLILKHAELEERSSDLETGRRGFASRTAWRLAGAALGLCLIVASFFVVRRQWEGSSAPRGAQTGILLLAPGPGQVMKGSFLFRWKSSVLAEYYVLELFDESLSQIWASERADGTMLQVPENVMSRLLPGKKYHWLVTGYSGGYAVVESALGRFSVRPEKR